MASGPKWLSASRFACGRGLASTLSSPCAFRRAQAEPQQGRRDTATAGRWGDQKAQDRADAFGALDRLRIERMQPRPRRGIAPADHVAVFVREQALHRAALDARAGPGPVLGAGSLGPAHLRMVFVEALAIARRPRGVVAEGLAVEEGEEVAAARRRERMDLERRRLHRRQNAILPVTISHHNRQSPMKLKRGYLKVAGLLCSKKKWPTQAKA